MENEGIKNLACAIIYQALNDYKRLKRGKMKEKSFCNMVEIVNFFKSDYAELLSYLCEIDISCIRKKLGIQ